ncbi:recombinase family protein [Candidatus Daviesbacteria bacterium]|nr:recombinase family protein [Candidatus Daviesbacteria bacterium]
MEPNTAPIKNAVIYLRVSSEEQVENFSLSTQEEICTKDATRRGYQIIEIFKEEGKSAKNIAGRPELLKLLDYCRRNRRLIDAVFVYRIDRISRQTQDYLFIRKKLFDDGISIISANEPTGNSPTDKLLETIMASFAQHDNDVRSERTKNGLRARFKSGLCIGHAPLGYRVENGYALKDGKNFELMKKAWALVTTGTKSLEEMARIMNNWGMRKAVRGKEYKLRSQTVSRLFHLKFYMGILTSSKYSEEVQGQHDAMITEDQYYKVQAIIEGRNRCGMTVGKRLKDNPDFPLRRSIKCGKCGGQLSGGWSKGRSKKYAYYICQNRCGASSIAVEKLKTGLIDFLHNISPSEEQIEVALMVLRNTFTRNINTIRTKRDQAEEQLTQLKLMRDELVLNHLRKVYTDEIFEDQNKKLGVKITAFEAVLGQNTFYKYTMDQTEKFVREKFKDLGETYEKSEPGEKRVLLGSICPTGLVWQYPGLSNQQFSPEYQAFLNVRTNQNALRVAEGS